MSGQQAGRSRSGRNVVGVLWRGVAFGLLLLVVGSVIALEIAVSRASPILKGRVLETLATRFDGRVELDRFQVSVFHGLNVEGGGLRIYAPAAMVAAGVREPLFRVQEFSFRAGLLGLFERPTHVGEVRVSGMEIYIPPRELRRPGTAGEAKQHRRTEVLVDRIRCENSRLVIGTSKPDKEPKTFELREITLEEVGPDAPWRYEATLQNAVPRGEIHASGTFGPWVVESPGDAGVSGHYTFQHADLNTIKGIGGMLSSKGEFGGQLDRIDVHGTADVPNFSLDTAEHAVPLETSFHAIVDGTSGDTYLQPVQARLGASRFTCRGAVVNRRGVGHTIDLDVDLPDGRLEDFLALSVKTRPVVMTARIAMKTRLHIPPGRESVTRKLGLRGRFTLRQIRFNNPEIQDKVDRLSLRAQGTPVKSDADAAEVRSEMLGRFALASGSLRFDQLDYEMPGATVHLTGEYSLDGNRFDFAGQVRTKAKISQMVSSRWRSLLLKPVDPFFRKNGAGAEIPVTVSGTRGAPKFGLNLFGGHDDATRGSRQESTTRSSR